jgi:hypothetical protein
VTERLIREAHEEGRFDDLPGHGRRLDLDDDPREGEMGLAFHILRTNDAVPPWIGADLEARRCADALERVLGDAVRAGDRGALTPLGRSRFRTRLARAIDDHDRAVEALNASAPSLTLHRRRCDRAALEQRLDAALEGRTGDAPPSDGRTR